MTNENPALQLADKLSRFDQSVWGSLPNTIRNAVVDYKEADQNTRQRIVDNLHKIIVKHDETLTRIYWGPIKRKALFDLAWENRTTVEERLKC